MSTCRRVEGGGAAWEPPVGLHADLTIAHGRCRSGAACPSSGECRNVRASVFFGAIRNKDESLAVGADR